MEMVLIMLIVCGAVLVSTADDNAYTNFAISNLGCFFDFVCFIVVIYIIYVFTR